LGENQIRNLGKIRAFVSNSILRDDRQHDIRSRCLEYWEVGLIIFLSFIRYSTFTFLVTRWTEKEIHETNA